MTHSFRKTTAILLLLIGCVTILATQHPILASSATSNDYPLLYNKLRDSVLRAVIAEIDGMSSLTASLPQPNPEVTKIQETFVRSLERLDSLFDEGKINPLAGDLITESTPTMLIPSARKSMRVGYFPVAADPLHWAHLLTAFEAMAQLALDKVVFIVAGADPRKPELTEVNVRHTMAKNALNMFGDYCRYSDIAMQGNDDGETNVFRELKRNPHLAITAFYLVGSDHFNWQVSKNGKLQDDTIKKLEDNMNKAELGFAQFKDHHHLVAAFISRNRSEISESKLAEMKSLISYDIEVVVPTLSYSSTQIREYFQSKSPRGQEPLAYLPLRTYGDILAHGLYGKGRQP